jgi:hypothetical protein
MRFNVVCYTYSRDISNLLQTVVVQESCPSVLSVKQFETMETFCNFYTTHCWRCFQLDELEGLYVD